MNNKKQKKENPTFVLNDVIKRKILDMYKISKSKSRGKKAPPKSKKTPNIINNFGQNSNTN